MSKKLVLYLFDDFAMVCDWLTVATSNSGCLVWTWLEHSSREFSYFVLICFALCLRRPFGDMTENVKSYQISVYSFLFAGYGQRVQESHCRCSNLKEQAAGNANKMSNRSGGEREGIQRNP